MGWTGYESSMPIGINKKRYCYKCGTKLQKSKIKKIYHKGELGFEKDIDGMSTMGMTKKVVTTYGYRCEKCDYVITHSEQLVIHDKQKKLGKLILTEEERYYTKAEEIHKLQRENKIIIIASIICTIVLVVVSILLLVLSKTKALRHMGGIGVIMLFFSWYIQTMIIKGNLKKIENLRQK